MEYDHSRDKNKLFEICKDVYDGEDYLPHIILHWLQNEKYHLFTLQDERFETLHAFCVVIEEGDGCCLLKAVRVNKNCREKGIIHLLVFL